VAGDLTAINAAIKSWSEAEWNEDYSEDLPDTLSGFLRWDKDGRYAPAENIYETLVKRYAVDKEPATLSYISYALGRKDHYVAPASALARIFSAQHTAAVSKLKASAKAPDTLSYEITMGPKGGVR
jgi:hypothetical protein